MDIQEPTAKEKIQEKATRWNQDFNIGALVSLVPGMVSAVAEYGTTSNIMHGTVDRIPELIQKLPFPVLYDLFEKAPDGIREYLVPILLGSAVFMGGAYGVGIGINKLRYFTRSRQLKEEINDSKECTLSALTKFHQKSKLMTAKRAYTETKNEMMI